MNSFLYSVRWRDDCLNNALCTIILALVRRHSHRASHDPQISSAPALPNGMFFRRAQGGYREVYGR